jgi:hypothetical protein
MAISTSGQKNGKDCDHKNRFNFAKAKEHDNGLSALMIR